MSELKFIHTADLHLGSAFSSLPPEKAAQRRIELCELPQKIIRLAEKEQADAVLISGDLFDSISPEKDALSAFVSGVRMTDIPVFIAPGNHDYYCASSVYAKAALPTNVFLFTRNEVEYFDFSDRGFRVFGAAFQSEFSRPLLDGLKVEKTDGITDVMCLHGEVCRGGSSYSKITPEQIAGSALDYLALGHVHRATELQRAGNTFYSYPGCPEGRGFDEAGRKTVNIVKYDGRTWQIRTEELAARRVEELKLDISGRDLPAALNAALPARHRQDIYAITLYGLTYAVPEINVLPDDFRDGFFDLKMTDLTQRLEEVFSEACGTTLRGIFIEKMREIITSAASEKDRIRAVNALRWGLAALDGSGEAVRHDD